VLTAHANTQLHITHDGPITIATGRSRKETNWKNREMLWSELLSKLSNTTRTRESYAEYRKLTKPQQADIKDVGGFVGGALKGGRRKVDTVVWRQILTLDADFAQGDLWSSVELLCDYACAVYSTHKHCPEKPRLRLVIPLARPVTPDEYPAIGRRIAADIGIDFFDDTTYEPHRLMYWPSTAADGEYVFKHQDEPWLDPDQVLARYPDWRDPSFWPESSRVQQERKKLADKQGDPTAKPGIIGAFCRTYSVEEAIEAFLTDIYEPCGDGRYTYIQGSTSGGLVVYDAGKFVYSHHGTDPIGGRLVNAFDLVRIHKFSALDEDIEPGTPTVSLPSYSAMQEFCLADDQVKVTLGSERLANAQNDFNALSEDNEWVKDLEYNKKGELVTSLANLVLILRNDPNLQEIAYNAHKNTVVLVGPTPWRKPTDWTGPTWSDEDDSSLRVYLEKVYNIWAPAKLNDALAAVSHERAFHPIREYLGGVSEWDGIPRLEELLIDYLGADDTPYVRAVTRKTFVAAVARVMNPGCKFDYMLVLNGPQGIGKSTLFAKLGGKWFNDSLNMNDVKDKAAAEKLQGYWILEIGELAGIRKAEVEAVKSFLSRQRDIYRPAFGRRTVEHPRQCIIVGSTNADMGFLRDSTGNRRFWPVLVHGTSRGMASWDLNTYTIGQIWAEALDIWKAGEDLYLTGDVAKEALEQQKLALESDERLGLIRDYLERRLPKDWEDMPLSERRQFIHSNEFGQAEGTIERDRVCVAEIWCELFCRDLTGAKRFEIDEIHSLMRQVDGWERYQGNRDGKLRFRLYGMQRAYIKSEE
jgi:putative DNA primase/helicase